MPLHALLEDASCVPRGMLRGLQFPQLWAVVYQTKIYLKDLMLFPNLLKGKEVKRQLSFSTHVSAALVSELVTQRTNSMAQVPRR